MATKEYVPGIRLKDYELAKEFGLSKMPVRIALNRLAADGLIQIKARSSTFTREFDQKSISEVFIMRESLEALAMELGWGNYCEDVLTKFKKEIIKISKLKKDKKMINRTLDWDRRFHDYICTTCDNILLIEVLKKVSFLGFYVMVNQSDYPFNPELTSKEHTNIIDAIIDGNKDLAIQSMKIHIRNARLYMESKLSIGG